MSAPIPTGRSKCMVCNGEGHVPGTTGEALAGCAPLLGLLWLQWACALVAYGLLCRYGATTPEAVGGGLLIGSAVGAVYARVLRVVRGGR